MEWLCCAVKLWHLEPLQQPILARSKGAERKIEDEKLEYKARKVLAAEKKALASKDRVVPDYTTMDYEKKLRKVATRGGGWWSNCHILYV